MSSNKRGPSASPQSDRRLPKRLHYAQDLLSADQHAAFDAEVKANLELGIPQGFDPSSHLNQMLLLTWILATCPTNFPVDRSYTSISKANNLLMSHPEIAQVLAESFEKGSYKNIRNLDLLRLKEERSTSAPLAESSIRLVPTDESEAATLQAWNEKYVGNASEILFHTMVYCMKDSKKDFYARYLSIVQSSGMGKSRTVDELAKLCPVIQLNLRNDEGTGFPAPDNDVRDFLVHSSTQKEAYHRAQVLLYSIFVTIKGYLVNLDTLVAQISAGQDSHALSTPGKLRLLMTAGQRYHEQGPTRKDFYTQVVQLARNVSSESSFSESAFRQAADDVVSLLKPITKTGAPALVISFDEAHVLTEAQKSSSANGGQPWSRFTELRRALLFLKNHPYFFLFLSTTGKASQFTPSAKEDLSSRVASSVLLLLSPFTEVGFDQLAERIQEGQRSIKDVSETAYMCKFGRPLFGSRYANGSESVRSSMVPFALEKLIPSQKVGDMSKDAKLACMSVRLPLEFNPTTPQLKDREMRFIEKHMRVCLDFSSDFSSAVTVAPSEPLLAEAAFSAMWAEGSEFDLPGSLAEELQSPGMSKGDRGELIAMTILLLARDRASIDRDGRVIQLVDFIRAIFPSNETDRVLDMAPSRLRVEEDNVPLKESFKNASVYFNHFIRVNDFGVLNRKYLWRLIARGAAVLCAENQAGSDILIPFLYFDEVLQRTNVSAIFVQVKNDGKFSNTPKRFLFDAMNPFFLNFFDRNEEPIPIIRMVFALAARQPGVIPLLAGKGRSTRGGKGKGKSTSHKYTAYDIWCCRASDETFGPIKKDEVGTYDRLLKASRTFPAVYECKRVPGAEATKRNMNPGTETNESHWSCFIDSDSSGDSMEIADAQSVDFEEEERDEDI